VQATRGQDDGKTRTPRDNHCGRRLGAAQRSYAPAVTFDAPPALSPGDLVCVVAPSGPFAPSHLWPGLAWLRTRYRIRISAGVLARDGYFAGPDDRRRAELHGAMCDPEVKAIVVARGGYGATRVLANLPWQQLRERPKWIVGFSDVTALHAMAWSRSLASIHGPNVTGLGPEASPAVRASWLAALERPRAPRTWRGLRVVRGGTAGGPLVGGNLSLLCAMAAGGQLVVPRGAVLAIEDVNEAPYRIDRMLASLQLGGYLQGASALVFGGLDGATPGPDGWTTDEVIDRLARSLTVPVLAGAPFGHRPHNEAFVLGAEARVAGDAISISFGGGEAECSA
jgi:muramoyltetrapeptide carboxypeptidase